MGPGKNGLRQDETRRDEIWRDEIRWDAARQDKTGRDETRQDFHQERAAALDVSVCLSQRKRRCRPKCSCSNAIKPLCGSLYPPSWKLFSDLDSLCSHRRSLPVNMHCQDAIQS